MTLPANIRLRPWAESDVAAVLGLIRELAEHQGEADALRADEAGLRAAGFSERPKMWAMVAEADGEAAGVVTWTRDYSPWSACDVLHVDDLYVTPAHRAHGLGEALMREMFARAEAEGAAVVWSVSPENTGGIKLYERLGADHWLRRKCVWRPDGA